MFHDHTCNYYLVKFSDMPLQRPGDAEEMQSLINCRIHVFWGNTKSMTNSCTQSYNKLYMGFWCAISSQYDKSCVSVKQLNLHDCIIIWSPVNINTFCALCSDNSAKALHSSFQEKNPHGSQDVQPTLYRIKQIQRNTITLTEKSNQLWEGAFIKVFHLLLYLNEFYCKPLTNWLKKY